MAVGGRIFWFSGWDSLANTPEAVPGLDNVVHVNLGAYLFRRELFDAIGVFEESQLFAEDVDLILRMADHDIPFALLDKVTLFYRRHDQSMTAARSDREQADFRRALFRSCAAVRRVKALDLPFATGPSGACSRFAGSPS